MITGDYIKPGATVIDVGTNRIDDRERGGAHFPELGGETGGLR